MIEYDTKTVVITALSFSRIPKKKEKYKQTNSRMVVIYINIHDAK